jgi:hypothetical protein
VYANQWHKTGFARQAAAWEKANSENTWKHGAHENYWSDPHHSARQHVLTFHM